jgi:hypothetical protein
VLADEPAEAGPGCGVEFEGAFQVVSLAVGARRSYPVVQVVSIQA